MTIVSIAWRHFLNLRLIARSARPPSIFVIASFKINNFKQDGFANPFFKEVVILFKRPNRSFVGGR